MPRSHEEFLEDELEDRYAPLGQAPHRGLALSGYNIIAT